MTSKFGDRFDVDLARRRHAPTHEPESSAPPEFPRALVSLSQYDNTGDQPLYMACDGSRCQARRRSDKSVVADADTLLVGQPFCTSSKLGIWLISHLTRLDESARVVSRVDAKTGKVRWTLPGPDTKGGRCWALGDDLLVSSYGASPTQVWLANGATGKVLWHLGQRGVADVRVMPLGDRLLVGLGTTLYAMPRGAGAELWRAEL